MACLFCASRYWAHQQLEHYGGSRLLHDSHASQLRSVSRVRQALVTPCWLCARALTGVASASWLARDQHTADLWWPDSCGCDCRCRESHSHGVSLKHFEGNQMLKDFFRVTSLSPDKEGKVCSGHDSLRATTMRKAASLISYATSPIHTGRTYRA